MPNRVQTGPRYNNTQLFLLVSDIACCVLWTAVNARLLVLLPLIGIRFLPGGIADFFLTVNFGTVLIDLFDYVTIFGKVASSTAFSVPRLMPLVFTCLERFITSAVILSYPRSARCKAFATLIYAESLLESIRCYYNFYKVRTFGRHHRILRAIKKLSYTILVPVQTVCELILLFTALQFDSYYDILNGYSTEIKTTIRVLAIFYLPCFYAIYRRKIYEYYYLDWKNKGKHEKQTWISTDPYIVFSVILFFFSIYVFINIEKEATSVLAWIINSS